ncbi:Ribonuclease 3 [bioreactor metagenome]|uniref:ribonuclease III n=1 Tax=bioreactor metagenome TaxID=1076179 RepID=A0A644T0G8_9ZZZZ|nr:ribonuclease III [Negativicutes bacterium]
MKMYVNAAREQQLNALCDIIKVKFGDMNLLQQALTHTSFANESKHQGIIHNERLEFLGDAVLDLVISEHLFRRFPGLPEGDLTKARAMVVCEPTLAQCSSKITIGNYILLGRGESASGGRERLSILADAFEAVIGAIYLDSGFEVAAKFVLDQLNDELKLIERGDYLKDYKTSLQEVVQKNNESKITYEIAAERGPDHDKLFDAIVLINGIKMGRGSGRSKKEAEQRAAKQALIKLDFITE